MTKKTYAKLYTDAMICLFGFIYVVAVFTHSHITGCDMIPSDISQMRNGHMLPINHSIQ